MNKLIAFLFTAAFDSVFSDQPVKMAKRSGFATAVFIVWNDTGAPITMGAKLQQSGSFAGPFTDIPLARVNVVLDNLTVGLYTCPVNWSQPFIRTESDGANPGTNLLALMFDGPLTLRLLG